MKYSCIHPFVGQSSWLFAHWIKMKTRIVYVHKWPHTLEAHGENPKVSGSRASSPSTVFASPAGEQIPQNVSCQDKCISKQTQKKRLIHFIFCFILEVHCCICT